MSLYTDSNKFKDIPPKEYNEIAEEFITPLLDSERGVSVGDIAEKHKMSSDMVMKVLKFWITTEERHSFYSVLSQKIDSMREEWQYKKNLEEYFNTTIDFPWRYKQDINLSTYSIKDVNQYFYHLIKIPQYCILGGVQKDNIFHPVFTHCISQLRTGSTLALEVKDDDIKITRTDFPETKYSCFLNSYEAVKVITTYNCNAYILGHYGHNIHVAAKRLERILNEIGVKLIDDIGYSAKEGDDKHFYTSSARLHNKINTYSYTDLTQDINLIDVIKIDNNPNQALENANKIKGKFFGTFLDSIN